VQVGAGVLAGEQPPGIGQGARGAERFGDRQRGDERVQGRDEQQRLGAESKVGVAVAGLDVAGGQGGDLRGGLGVEQDQAGGGAVLDAGGVGVVQEPAGQGVQVGESAVQIRPCQMRWWMP
jgi:hypothetical protein